MIFIRWLPHKYRYIHKLYTYLLLLHYSFTFNTNVYVKFTTVHKIDASNWIKLSENLTLFTICI